MSEKYAVIGDVHDNYDHLVRLLHRIGVEIDNMQVKNQIDRQIVFVGDLVDRGDEPVKVLRLVMDMVEKNQALIVRGNHDDKLYRALKGNKIKMNDELSATIEKINAEESGFRQKVFEFLESLPYYLCLDNDSLYIVHGAAPEYLQLKNTNEAKAKALYGVTTGQYIDGFPERINWGKEYKGKRHVIYGHQAIDTPVWVNNTIDIDTGCFKSGILSCVLWPEKEIISVGNEE